MNELKMDDLVNGVVLTEDEIAALCDDGDGKWLYPSRTAFKLNQNHPLSKGLVAAHFGNGATEIAIDKSMYGRSGEILADVETAQQEADWKAIEDARRKTDRTRKAEK